MSATNIQIAIRIRPFIEREKREKLEPQWKISENSIVQIDSTQDVIGEPYSFDHIFDDTASNQDVYDSIVHPLVLSCLEGINCTIFAYGQTSSGKTHTVMGEKGTPGILKYMVDNIFKYIESDDSKQFLLRCSFLEIYNEKINDLLDTDAIDLKIREHNSSVYVIVNEQVISKREELFFLMRKGMKTRKTGCTDMNERSSRSHTIFRLIIQAQNQGSGGQYTESILSLVDLAGSERVGQMKMDRDRQMEGVCINKSLTTLGLVIRKLSDNEQYINYRDSKLTRLLQHSLGGNSKTLIIAAITTAVAEETKSTLEFAQRAKYVRNRPIINKRATDKDQLKIYEHLYEDCKTQLESVVAEKLESEKTILALKCKLYNIKKFSGFTMDSSSNNSTIPNRRHTLGPGHYHRGKENTPVALVDFANCTEDAQLGTIIESKEEELIKTPSLLRSPVTAFQEGQSATPKTHQIHKLKLEVKSIEESYESLKEFTNLEKEFFGDIGNRLGEYRDYIGLLTEKNCWYISIISELKEELRTMKSMLIRLKNGLSGQSQTSEFLDTIMEEELDHLSRNIQSLPSEREFYEKDEIMKNHISEKLSFQTSLLELQSENDRLAAQLAARDYQIKSLTDDMKTVKKISEAEVEILSNKIQKMAEYKEEMHKKMSQMQADLEDRTGEEQLNCMKAEKILLTNKLENAELQIENMRQQLATALEDLEEKTELYQTMLNQYGSKDDQIINLEKEFEALKEQQLQLLEDSSMYSQFETLSSKEKDQLASLSLKLNAKEAECQRFADDKVSLTNLLKEMESDKENIVGALGKENAELRNQLDTLAKENQRLESELQDVQLDFDAELKETDKLCKELDKLTDSEAQKSCHIKMLEEEQSKLKIFSENKVAEIESLNQDREALSRKVTDQDTLIKSLRQEIDFKDEQIQSSLKENAKLEEEIRISKDECNLKSTLKDSKSCENVAGLYQETESKAEQIESLQKEIISKEAKIQSSLTENVKLQEKIRIIKEECDGLRTTLCSLQSVQKEIENVETLRRETENKAAQIESLREEISSKEAKIESLLAENLKLREEIRIINEESDRFKITLNDLQSTQKERIDNVEDLRQETEIKAAQIESLREEISSKVAKIESLLAENLKLREEIRIINEESDHLKITLNDLQSTQKERIENVEGLRQEIEIKAAQIESLREEIGSKVAKIEFLLAENLKLREEIRIINEESDRLKITLSDLQLTQKERIENIEGLRQETESKAVKIKSLHEEISSKEAKIQNFLIENSKLQEEICSVKEETDGLKKSLSYLQSKQNEKIENVEALRQQIERKDTEIRSSLQEISKLRTELGVAKKEHGCLKVTLTNHQLEQKEIIENLQKEIQKKNLETKSLKQIAEDNKCLKSQLNDKNTSYNLLFKEHSALNLRVTTLEATLKELEQTIETQKKTADNFKTCSKILTTDLANLHSNDSQKVTELQQELALSQHNLDKQSHEIQLKTLHEVKSRQRLNESIEKANLLSETTRLRNENLGLKKQLRSLFALSEPLKQEEALDDGAIWESDEMKSILLGVQKFKEFFKVKLWKTDGLARERNDLEFKIRSLEASELKMRGELRVSLKKCQELHGKIDLLEEQLSKAKENVVLKSKESGIGSKKFGQLFAQQPEAFDNSPEPLELRYFFADLDPGRLARENSDLQKKLKDLSRTHEHSQSKFTTLKQNYESLIKNKCDLISIVEKKENEFSTIQRKLNSIQEENKKLKLIVEEYHKQEINLGASSLTNGRESKKTLPVIHGDEDKKSITPRLSDRPRSMSPHQVRKIRRQSLVDQRRGLSPEIDSTECLANGPIRVKTSEFDVEEPVRCMLNKEVQVSCECCLRKQKENDELADKYKKLNKLALMRRKEGNILRQKLNLPPDCPVIP
ncbi:uncharacterized protein [Euwallacea similis]|uniref:uncharacterized protein n=1 Tax=Euwallacea similis TaxID=1736056 RepID=UPI00344FB8EF